MKIETLARDWGYRSSEEMLADPQVVLDSCVPSICMNADCDYTTEMEPDQDRGWCECCGTNSMSSALILAGWI